MEEAVECPLMADFSKNIRKLTSTRDTFRQVENGDGEMEAHNVATFVHRLSEAPTRREIECLVGKLMTFHKKLGTDGDRIQLDIEAYGTLSQEYCS
jgi:hypothetical protein